MSGILRKSSNLRFGIPLVRLLACSMFTTLAVAGEQEVMSGSAAAAIRESGNPCAHVIQMDRLKEGAAEGFTVWDVRCNSGRFQVKFKGDTGSEVVPLD